MMGHFMVEDLLFEYSRVKNHGFAVDFPTFPALNQTMSSRVVQFPSRSLQTDQLKVDHLW